MRSWSLTSGQDRLCTLTSREEHIPPHSPSVEGQAHRPNRACRRNWPSTSFVFEDELKSRDFCGGSLLWDRPCIDGSCDACIDLRKVLLKQGDVEEGYSELRIL